MQARPTGYQHRRRR